jgi:hypothetical protein
MARRQLSERNRRILIATAAVEAALKAAMLIDLRSRTDAEVRGARRLWGWSALVNSAGLIPIAYFVVGRRRSATRR